MGLRGSGAGGPCGVIVVMYRSASFWEQVPVILGPKLAPPISIKKFRTQAEFYVVRGLFCARSSRNQTPQRSDGDASGSRCGTSPSGRASRARMRTRSCCCECHPVAAHFLVVTRLSADIGFARFDDSAVASEFRLSRKIWGHREANAMHQDSADLQVKPVCPACAIRRSSALKWLVIVAPRVLVQIRLQMLG